MDLKHSNFKFPLPYTLTREHLNNGLQDYMASPKIDGERALICFKNQTVQLVYRSFKTETIGTTLVNTDKFILDGEVCYEGGTCIWYGFDYVDLSGQMDYPTRLQELESCIDWLYAKCVNDLSVGLVLKKVVPFAQLEELLDCNYKTDGFVFTKKDCPYISPYESRSFAILKWKFPEQNTIDFFINFSKKKMMELFVQGNTGKILISSKKISTCHRSNGIYECRYNTQKSQWEIVRPRPDKTHPNHIITVFHTMEAILDGIQLPELLKK
jgi:mRNA capping enzyme, C-terminal domain